MKNRVLVLNAGSSSLKFAFFEDRKKKIFGKCDRIGSNKSHLVINDYESTISFDIKDFRVASEIVAGLIASLGLEFDTIGHRVVHGGNLKKSVFITEKIEKIIKEYSIFALLHNPNELEVIDYFKRFKKRQYAVFDTSFFFNLPEKSRTYPIPENISRRFSIRRYGFHGLSHEYVAKKFRGKTICCHLGNGVSLSALKNGNPLDCSMGLTPLEGLMMGTRAGDLDPGLVLFLKEKGYDVKKILNFQSGFKAFGDSNDIREIINSKNKRVQLGLDIFIYRIIKYIGAYTAVLRGLDNLVFTGGIGENSPVVREMVCNNLDFLGVKIDKIKNSKALESISDKSSKIKISIVKTNEEETIAKEVLKEIN